MEFNNEVLAENIRSRLGVLKMSRRELAEKAGVSVSTVNLCANGEQIPGADKLFAMSEALQCTPNDLLGWQKTA